jgi:hypothetical protein
MIRVQCPKCGATFREKPSKIRNGAVLACPNCSQPLTIDSNSEHSGIRRALTEARKIRRQALSN